MTFGGCHTASAIAHTGRLRSSPSLHGSRGG